VIITYTLSQGLTRSERCIGQK